MREVVFLKNNQKKWKEIESLMNNKSSATADQLAEVFIELTDDLAYAQTYYPDSKLTLYLNDLTADLYRYIYRNKKEKDRRLLTFWTRELPMEFYKSRKVALFAFIIFSVFVVIGALSSIYDETYLTHFTGTNYLNETYENIENGDPIAVYAGETEGVMFLKIAWNNIMVSFFMFVSGITLGIWTVVLLSKNSLMLGSFQYLFIAEGVFLESFLGIWIHGIIEISCMIIASTAGFLVAKSMIFPGTYSRPKSFQKGVKQATKIFLGIIPLVVLAAFLESYITNPREYDLHWIARAIIILASSAFILWYFLLYPVQLNRKLNNTKIDKEGHIIYGSVILIVAGVLTAFIYFASDEIVIDPSIWFLIGPLALYGIYRIIIGLVPEKRVKNEERLFTN